MDKIMTGKRYSNVEAHTMKLRAEKLRKMIEVDPSTDPNLNRKILAEATELVATADASLKPSIPPPPAALGGEVSVQFRISPDFVAIDASSERVQLATHCNAFNMALDTAETIGAKDATEQMLAHQMAAVHRMAMVMAEKSLSQRDTIEMARLANTAARLMDTYQKAMLTLSKVRTGGKQTVTVQHVQVQDGGQAVINGAVNTGGPSKRGEGEK